MRVNWARFINNDKRDRHGTQRERRFLEIQISLAIEVHRLRWNLRLSQQQPAELLGVSQARVSKAVQELRRRAALPYYSKPRAERRSA